jgi:hypothetical protein
VTMRSLLLLGAVTLLSAMPATAQQKGEPPSVSAFDIFLEPGAFAGKTVKVTDCSFFNAKASWVNCGVFSPKNGKQVGNLLLTVKNAEPELKRQLLTDCAGDSTDEECQLDVVGRIAVSNFGVVTIERARLAR